MARETRQATSIDVGRLAGVSPKTVSRVFNDAPYVSDGVKRRVRDAAEALNYRPNLLAKGLVRRRSHLIGLVYENPSPSYVVELQMGVLDRLMMGPYRMMVIPIRSVEAHASDVADLARSATLGGVVLAPPASDHPLILSQLAQARIFCARVSPSRDLGSGSVVLIDDVAAAAEIAGHLLTLGHRRIGIIKGDLAHPSAHERWTGYLQAFAAAGVQMQADLVAQGSYTFESGYQAGRVLLTRSDRPTAILAQNDEMAVGAMIAARELGLSVPGEVSFAGFDDTEVSRTTWPRLTTIHQPVFEMARDAADMLIQALDGDDSPRRVDHSHRMMIRESTARAP